MINYKYYFTIGPILYTGINIGLNILNINWKNINIPIIIFYFLIQSICTFSISEILLTYLLIPFIKSKNIPNDTQTRLHNDSIIINYNLKAYSQKDIDLCFKNMYDAYINNIFNNTVAVLISVTEDEKLKKYEEFVLFNYRSDIIQLLSKRGEEFLQNSKTDTWWKKRNVTSRDLYNFCHEKANNFILIYRDTNVLKKCGQYQDLICLSEGYNYPYTYNDTSIYGINVRIPDKMFNFMNDNDYDTIYNKHFKYTLVLDSDTVVEEGFINDILSIAERNNNYDIFQPKIELTNIHTIYQYLQKIWLDHSNLSYTTITSYLQHSAFFGKGLINNKKYIDKCIGRPGNLIEYVPINALSHDTFESMCMSVLFIPEVSLYEDAPKNYLSWNFRELRWDMGELIVFSHLFPKFFKKRFKLTRQKYSLSFQKGYFALSSFRILIMWPILLIFIIINQFVPFYNYYLSYFYIILTTIIIPNSIKFYYYKKHTLLFLVTSIIQVLPEPIIGTTRLLISIYKLLGNNVIWIPSATLNNINSNIIIMSFYYFGLYSITSSVLLYFYYSLNVLLSLLLISVAILPLYNIFTNIKNPNCNFRIGLRKIKVIK